MQLVETKSSKLTYQQLKERLAVEKLRHVCSILTYLLDLNFGVVQANAGSFALYWVCENCEEAHFLESYSMDEAVSLTAEFEAIRLAELE
ncbi:hypothetical protein LLE49_07945 [Alicyclobacillus tolerans]|uniref:hypothetical protein n=1 Tax=Alicyclobacillus tolerans TaxID=90970 RepID=UPI001F21431D|nr:hypothetical protein [Alicyclobacillus tolerans]MCF8564677.1 hypothetical protein [Alicyclobacillus tolerans]